MDKLDESFHVTLMNNPSDDGIPEHGGLFASHFDHRKLMDGKWTVALRQISFTNCFNLLPPSTVKLLYLSHYDDISWQDEVTSRDTSDEDYDENVETTENPYGQFLAYPSSATRLFHHIYTHTVSQFPGGYFERNDDFVESLNTFFRDAMGDFSPIFSLIDGCLRFTPGYWKDIGDRNRIVIPIFGDAFSDIMKYPEIPELNFKLLMYMIGVTEHIVLNEIMIPSRRDMLRVKYHLENDTSKSTSEKKHFDVLRLLQIKENTSFGTQMEYFIEDPIYIDVNKAVFNKLWLKLKIGKYHLKMHQGKTLAILHFKPDTPE